MNKLSQLQRKITQLRQEKEQLRLFLHEIIEAYYRTINGSTATKEDQENAEEDDE